MKTIEIIGYKIAGRMPSENLKRYE